MRRALLLVSLVAAALVFVLLERAPRPPIAANRTAAPGAVLAQSLALPAPAPSSPSAAAAPAADVPAPLPPRVQKIQALQAQLAETRRAAAFWQQEATAAKQATAQCLAALAARRPPQADTLAPAATRAGSTGVVTLGTPQVQILNDQILVTGKLYNGGDQDAAGSLRVELLRDGRVVDSAEQPFLVIHGAEYAWSQGFRDVAGQPGEWQARATPRG